MGCLDVLLFYYLFYYLYYLVLLSGKFYFFKFVMSKQCVLTSK